MQIRTSRKPGRALLAALVALGALVLGAQGALASEGTLTLGPQKELVKKPAIVGGTAIPITQAPWQVFVEAIAGGTRYECGGSILNATHIVTAGHCVYDSATTTRVLPGAMRVTAGISNVNSQDSTAQIRNVVDIRVHPYYVYSAGNGGVAPDDVAVLELDAPLNLSEAPGTAAKAIAPAAAGQNPGTGAAGTISGFGLQAAGGQPDGQLYSVGTTVGDPLACGNDANALVVCISSAVGSACEGDSGGPLTVGGLLGGVASFVTLNGPTGECGVGSINGYTNVAAPEIQQFITGSDAPPRAPRGGRDVSAQGVFQAGRSMTCSAGTWTEAPTFAFTFVDTRNGQVLQSGANPTYTFTAADAGRTIACQASATSAGGTGITRTQASPAIAAAPVPPPAPPAPRRPAPRKPAPKKPSLRVSVVAATTHVVRGKTVAYTIRVSNRGRAAAKKVVVCDAPGRGLSFGSLPKGAKKSRGRACWSLGTLKAGRARRLKVTLRIARSRKPGLVGNVVSLSSSNGGRRTASSRVRVTIR